MQADDGVVAAHRVLDGLGAEPADHADLDDRLGRRGLGGRLECGLRCEEPAWQPPREHVGPRREERRQDREDEDVERGERGDPAVEPGRDRQRGEDQLELAAADEHQRGVGGRGAAVAVDPRGDDAGDDVERAA